MTQPSSREVAAALLIERCIGDALRPLAQVTDNFAAMGLLGTIDGELPQELVTAYGSLEAIADAVRKQYGGMVTQ